MITKLLQKFWVSFKYKDLSIFFILGVGILIIILEIMGLWMKKLNVFLKMITLFLLLLKRN